MSFNASVGLGLRLGPSVGTMGASAHGKDLGQRRGVMDRFREKRRPRS